MQQLSPSVRGPRRWPGAAAGFALRVGALALIGVGVAVTGAGSLLDTHAAAQGWIDERAVTLESLLAMRRAVEEVYVHPDIEKYIVTLVTKTRSHRQVAVGASPRGSLALLKLSRCRAALAGRDFVTPDDVKAYYAKTYTRANVWVGLAGGYPAGFADRVRADFSKLPEGEAREIWGL